MLTSSGVDHVAVDAHIIDDDVAERNAIIDDVAGAGKSTAVRNARRPQKRNDPLELSRRGSLRSNLPGKSGIFAANVDYSMSLMAFMGRTRTVREAGRAFCLTISPVNGFFTSLPPETAGFFTRVSFMRPR